MYDYHTHSSFSDDCSIPMEKMVQTAKDMGVRMYAVTDHYDPDYPADEQFAFNLDFENYHRKQKPSSGSFTIPKTLKCSKV